MKILYITNHHQIANASGGYISDYLNDLLYHGLYEILGADVIDSTPIVSLYRENEGKIDRSKLWGGFTAFWLIDTDLIDRTDILQKIEDKYYDLVIYGAIKRCQDYYQLVSSVYPNDKIILVDGSDDPSLSPLSAKHPYFKRELYTPIKGVYPISFSIPANKITTQINKDKVKGFGHVAPGVDETYCFDTEARYYQDYNASFYGVTMKKDGWDCMRHYEILGNYCMPYFIGLSQCPGLSMVDFPKKEVLDTMALFDNNRFDIHQYYDTLDALFAYTKTHLTTRCVAQKLLETVC